MNDDFKFLTNLCGVYDFGEFKTVDVLVVYANTRECSIRIYYKSMYTFSDSPNERKINEEKGEFSLKLGYMEFDLIYNNNGNDIIKKLIFNKYQDYVGQSLYVTKIY